MEDDSEEDDEDTGKKWVILRAGSFGGPSHIHQIVLFFPDLSFTSTNFVGVVAFGWGITSLNCFDEFKRASDLFDFF